MSISYLSLAGLTYYDSTVESRLGQKLSAHSGTKAYWNAQTTLVSEAGVLYIYTDYKTKTVNGNTVNIPGLKIGDGSAYLIDLPFVACNEEALAAHIANTTVHVTANERANWNNKVSCFLDPDHTDTVVFTTDDLIL